MQVLVILLYSIITVYGLLIIYFLVGWLKMPVIGQFDIENPSTKVSIIIPARNEEDNIGKCLQSIISQTFPTNLYEIIIVNDQSTDNTQQEIAHFIKEHTKHRIMCLDIEASALEASYKKKAIAMAIEKAGGTLIVTTDADCVMNDNWLRTIVSYYETHKPAMITAPVAYHQEDSFFEKMQTLEFLSLIGIGAASISLKKPIMCNGANLIYTKEAFYNVNGFKGTDNIASGDDTFLMFKMNKAFTNGVHFLKNREALVYTKAKATVAEFVSQRRRWASKTTKYNDPFIVGVGVITYLLNVLLLVTLIIGLFYSPMFMVFLQLFILKTGIDFIFLLPVISFFERRKLLWLLIPEQFLYMFYVVIVGVLAPFGKYTWKGRVVK